MTTTGQQTKRNSPKPFGRVMRDGLSIVTPQPQSRIVVGTVASGQSSSVATVSAATGAGRPMKTSPASEASYRRSLAKCNDSLARALEDPNLTLEAAA